MASSSAPASSAAGPHGQQLGSGGLGGRGEPRASGFVSEAESKRRSAFEGDSGSPPRSTPARFLCPRRFLTARGAQSPP